MHLGSVGFEKLCCPCNRRQQQLSRVCCTRCKNVKGVVVEETHPIPRKRSIMGVDEDFAAAVEFVRTWKPEKTVSNEDKLTVYALFKQATLGDVTTTRPGGFLNFEANAKWDAYNKLKGISTEEAKTRVRAQRVRLPASCNHALLPLNIQRINTRRSLTFRVQYIAEVARQKALYV